MLGLLGKETLEGEVPLKIRKSVVCLEKNQAEQFAKGSGGRLKYLHINRLWCDQLSNFICLRRGKVFMPRMQQGNVQVTRRASFTSVNNKVQDKVCGIAGIYSKSTWCKHLFFFPDVLRSLCIYENKTGH